MPYTTPALAPVDPVNGTAYDNADFDEALCLGHGNFTHLPNADDPFFDPDTFWSMHPEWSELPVWRRHGAFPYHQHQPDHVSIPDDHSRRRYFHRLVIQGVGPASASWSAPPAGGCWPFALFLAPPQTQDFSYARADKFGSVALLAGVRRLRQEEID